MRKQSVPDRLLQLLSGTDTPTVCNAIEVAQGKRGFAAFTRATVLHCDPSAAPMVGFARTARIAAAAPPSEPDAEIRSRRLEYFRSMAAGSRPGIAVIEDTDYPNCVGAWWGEVHTAVHKGLGLSGAITNGVMRDLDQLEPGFPVIAGSIGPSHGFVHVREIGTPVSVLGLTVEQGDLVHADRHGALVIPPEVIPHLASAIAKLLDTESLILAPSRKPDFDIEALEEAWRQFEKART